MNNQGSGQDSDQLFDGRRHTTPQAELISDANRERMEAERARQREEQARRNQERSGQDTGERRGPRR